MFIIDDSIHPLLLACCYTKIILVMKLNKLKAKYYFEGSSVQQPSVSLRTPGHSSFSAKLTQSKWESRKKIARMTSIHTREVLFLGFLRRFECSGHLNRKCSPLHMLSGETLHIGICKKKHGSPEWFSWFGTFYVIQLKKVFAIIDA